MSQDKILIQTPAKINLFLKVLNKRKDGYHNIISGVTFVNLFDEIEVIEDDKNIIKYHGQFKPSQGYYNDCIIKRLIEKLIFTRDAKLNINIKKNIPVQSGLGSASSNAAGLIMALTKLNLLDKKNIFNDSFFLNFGTDIACFLYNKNCIIKDNGSTIVPHQYPKYFFLLIKPSIGFSTKEMYSNLDLKNNNKSYIQKDYISNNLGNDFKDIASNKSQEIKNILNYLQSTNGLLFANITGSGSCCFAAYKEKSFAINAQEEFNKKFSQLWTFVAENNI